MTIADSNPQSETLTERRFALWPWLLALPVMIAICALLWTISIRMLAGDLTYQNSDAIMKAIGQAGTQGKTPPPTALTDQLKDQAMAMVARAATLNPISDQAQLALAKNQALAGNFAQAKETALRANKLLSSVETYDQLGYICMQLPDRTPAEQYFRAALSIDPSDTEAIERIIWLGKLNLNDRALQSRRPQYLQMMLDGLRDLDHYALFGPNAAYLWSQYWHERARASHSPLDYQAGFRAAALANNRPLPHNTVMLYKPKDMLPIMNYFLMGARGCPVLEDGRPFAAKLPVDPTKIIYR